MEVDSDSAKVTFPPPFIFLGMLLLGLALDRVLPWSVNLTAIGRYAGGGLLVGAGVVSLLLASGGFRKAKTDVKPWKTSSAIVSDGIYGMTRNPMYLGMALFYSGIGLIASSLGIIVVLPILIILIRTQVIAREERYLESKFGQEYLSYKAKVRRWI